MGFAGAGAVSLPILMRLERWLVLLTSLEAGVQEDLVRLLATSGESGLRESTDFFVAHQLNPNLSRRALELVQSKQAKH